MKAHNECMETRLKGYPVDSLTRFSASGFLYEENPPSPQPKADTK